ncbi:MAG: speB [Frankiales bacterium]|nr:speB [Frankiales bacterium]
MTREPGPISLTRGEWEVSYAGFQTFLKLPICLTPEDLRVGGIDVAVGGIPWDGTQATRSGTNLGPMHIRMADHLWGTFEGRPHLHTRVDPFEHLKMADYGDAQILPGAIDLSFANMKSFVGDILAGGAIPIILGGDHAITWPNVTAMAEHYGYGKIGVVHFDAHADTAPVMPGQLSSHGAPMRQLIESGAVKGRNFVQVGLRGYWPGKDIVQWMEDQEMRTHFMAEIQRHGFSTVLDRAIDEAMDGTPEHLFLSVDVDVCDPAFAPGTGSPEPGGLTSRELLWAVRRLAAEVGIAGMDVVEVSPPYDVGNNITALLAHRIVLEAMTGIAMRKAGITDRDYLDPRAADGPPPLGPTVGGAT